MNPASDFARNLRTCRWGALFALLAILFGFSMGGVFGAFEAPLKADLSEHAETVRDSVYAGDAAKMKTTLDKSWTYYKRAHLHGAGIGAAALGAILLLASLRRPREWVRRGVGFALGLGSLGYALFWMLAAHSAPTLGSTDAAKEALWWLAVPSAGMLLLGLIGVVVLTTLDLFVPARAARTAASKPDVSSSKRDVRLPSAGPRSSAVPG